MGVYYPPVGFHFKVIFELDGAGDDDTRFQEVTGIESDLETISVSEGGENRFSFTLPKRGKYPNLVLKRGLLQNSKITEWCRKAIENLDINPVTIHVTLLNENHEPLQSWSFINAWPKKWSVSGFNAAESRIVIESLEIVYQYFKKV
jgi:phage tail-like protein